MNKHTKKLTSLLLALVMVITIITMPQTALTAHAASTPGSPDNPHKLSTFLPYELIPTRYEENGNKVNYFINDTTVDLYVYANSYNGLLVTDKQLSNSFTYDNVAYKTINDSSFDSNGKLAPGATFGPLATDQTNAGVYLLHTTVFSTDGNGSVNATNIGWVPDEKALTSAQQTTNPLTVNTTKVTAKPNTGYQFDHWEIAAIGSDRKQQVKAIFTKIPTYDVTISAGDGGSVDTTSLNGVYSGSAVSYSDNKITINGTTITANAADGYVFDCWSPANCSSITSNTSFTANFAKLVNISELPYFTNYPTTVKVCLKNDVGMPLYAYISSSNNALLISNTDRGSSYTCGSFQFTRLQLANMEQPGIIAADSLVGSISGIRYIYFDATYTATIVAEHGSVNVTSVSGVSNSEISVYDENPITLNGTTITAFSDKGYAFINWNISKFYNGTRTITAQYTEAANISEITDGSDIPQKPSTSQYHPSYYCNDTAKPIFIYRSGNYGSILFSDVDLGDSLTYNDITFDRLIINGIDEDGKLMPGMSFRSWSSYNTSEKLYRYKTFDLSISADANGSVDTTSLKDIANNTEITVNENTITIGENTITATPNDKCEFVRFDGIPEDGKVTENLEITAVFKQKLQGWKQDGDKWYYYEAGVAKTGWLSNGGKWYYLDTNGVMVTGWKQLSGKWYYFETSGKMITGWKQISGKWYYFNTSGAMATSWTKASGKWYYFEASGTMAIGWKQLSGKWYYFETSGSMAIGWKQLSGKWYYFETSGAMAIGWKQLSGKWYYFNTSGAMVTGTQKISGKTYKFDSNGKWIN